MSAFIPAHLFFLEYTHIHNNIHTNTMGEYSFDASEIIMRFFKYALEGTIVAFAAYFIPRREMAAEDVLMIALIAAATFAVLDLFAPAIGSSVRTGAGFGIGANLVGFPGGSPMIR